MMLRPVGLAIGAIIAAVLVVHVESCFRCESGFFQSNNCPKGQAMASCFNEDKAITFRQTFVEKPLVMVGITGYYYDQGTNGRMVVKPRKRLTNGMIVRMGTWEDTHFYFMNVSYMACGIIPME